MIKKINLIIVALIMTLSMFSAISVSASSLDNLMLGVEFTNETPGVADSTITITGITTALQSEITNINISWGKSETEKVDGYYDIKNYTTTGPSGASTREAAMTSKLVYTNESFMCSLSGNLAIPQGATHLLVEVVTSSDARHLSNELPTEKRLTKATDELDYAMLWTSDIHFNKSAALKTSSQKEGMLDIVEVSKTYGDKFKGMILNGDIADTAANYEYAMAESTFEKSGVDFPVYYASGNHDIAMSSNGISKWDECAKAMDIRFKKLENEYGLTFDRSNPWSYETYIGGHHYIFLATPYETSYSVSDMQIKWLEEKICYDERSGVPTFVFTHLPIKDTVTQPTTSGGIENDALMSLFERHPQVIVITSHIHLELNSDMTTAIINTTGGTTYIDTASMYNTYWVENGKSTNVGATAQGRYLEFYDDMIVMKSRNMIDGKWIPRGEHIIPINELDNEFSGSFSISSSSAEGTIEVGTKLTAKLDGSKVPEGYTVTWYDMSGNLLATDSEYTVQVANASVSAKIVNDSNNSFARDVARYIVPVNDESSDDGGLEYQNTTDVVYNGNVVYVSGAADASLANKTAMLVLVPAATYNDITTAKYVGSCTTGTSGEYAFKFKADSISENDVLLINVGNTVVAANQIVSCTGRELVELDATMDTQGMLFVSLKNKFLDATTAKIILATYENSGKLIDVQPIDYSLAFEEGGKLQTYTHTTALEGDFVKVLLWSNFLDMTPLSKTEEIKIRNN